MEIAGMVIARCRVSGLIRFIIFLHQKFRIREFMSERASLVFLGLRPFGGRFLWCVANCIWNVGGELYDGCHIGRSENFIRSCVQSFTMSRMEKSHSPPIVFRRVISNQSLDGGSDRGFGKICREHWRAGFPAVPFRTCFESIQQPK